MVKFGDMVENVTERVDPAEAETDVYVGLEHLDPESLHLRQWGTPADVTGQKFAFKKGDIIFGRRRAYQRKLAVAEFDGICSAHALVVRAKPKVIAPQFLPFFMQSNMFMERAIGISVGSLSATINWRDLQVQEFPLPPIEEQRRIAEILWAADGAVEGWRKVREGLVGLLNIIRTQFTDAGWPEVILSDLLDHIQYGSSKPIVQEPEDAVPILRIPNVVGGVISLEDLRYTRISSKEREKCRISQGDVLMVRTNGNPEYVGRTAVVDAVPDGCVYASYLMRLRCDKRRLVPDYLHSALQARSLRTSLRHEIRSSAGNYNLNAQGIRKQRLPLPLVQEQMDFVAKTRGLLDKLTEIGQHTEMIREIARVYNNQAGTIQSVH